jgi:hypothetical protein
VFYREAGAAQDGLGIRHVSVVGRPTFDADDSLAIFGSFPGASHDPGLWNVPPSTGTVNLALANPRPTQGVIGGVPFIPGDGVAAPMAIGTSLFSMTGVRRFGNILGESPPTVIGIGGTISAGVGMLGLPSVQHVNWGGQTLEVFSSGMLWAPTESDIPAGIGVTTTGSFEAVRMPYLLGLADTSAGEEPTVVRGRQYCDVNLDNTTDIIQTTAVNDPSGGSGLSFTGYRVGLFYDGASFTELEVVEADASFVSADQAQWSVQSCSADGRPIVLSSPDRAISVGVPRSGL